MQASNAPTSKERFHIRAPTDDVSAGIPTSTNNIRPNAPEQLHRGRIGNHYCAHYRRRKIRCLPTETSLWSCSNCVRLNRHCQPPDEDVENDIEAPHSYDGKNDPGLAEPGGDRHSKDGSQLQDFFETSNNDERLRSRTCLLSRDWSVAAQQGDFPAHYETVDKCGEIDVKHKDGVCGRESSMVCQQTECRLLRRE